MQNANEYTCTHTTNRQNSTITAPLSIRMSCSTTCPAASQPAQEHSSRQATTRSPKPLDTWYQALPEDKQHNLQTQDNLNYCHASLYRKLVSLSYTYSCNSGLRRFHTADEAQAIALDEIWLSLGKYDPSRGITLSNFLLNRVHARLRCPRKPNLAQGRLFGDTSFPYTRFKKRPDGAAPIRRRNPTFVSLDAAVVANEASFASTDTGTSQVSDPSTIAAAATAALSPAAHHALLQLPSVWGTKHATLTPYYITRACAAAGQAHATKAITAELLAMQGAASNELDRLSA